MTKNSSDKEQKSIWDLKICTGPDHDLQVNGKELKGFEELIYKASKEADLNWFELASVLTYLAAAQIAAGDHQADATDGFQIWLNGALKMYGVQRTALLDGSNEILNPISIN